ncbi:MAG: sporulation protein YtfJ [Ruminococcaceae bacterium]|nr:sporulation protein YtfJ [Oscillospiraceae bacterium]
MSANNVNNIIGVSMEKIKEMVDVNTVLGKPVTTPDGTTVIPICTVNCGFASGGSDIPSSHAPQGGLFAGGSGAGITITPIAFLVIANGSVRILQIEPFTSSVDRVIQTVPDVVDKIGNLITTLKPEKAEAQEENI